MTESSCGEATRPSNACSTTTAPPPRTVGLSEAKRQGDDGWVLQCNPAKSALRRSEGSSVVETNNLRIHTRLALRHCGSEHLGVMDCGRAAWDQDKPHTLGPHGTSLRCRWIDLAAVCAEEGPCRRPPGEVWTGSDYAGRWSTVGVGFLRWSGIRTGSTRSISVY